jgi:glycosyltransferase involved in cell wall biosynthesis
MVYYTLKYKIKIYHLHGFFLYGLILGFILKKKVILKTTMIHDDDLDAISKRKYGKFKVWLIKKVVDINIALTKKIKEINSKYIEESKILEIPNGIEVEKLDYTDKKESNIFCFVGLICERKNTLKSIEYFKENYSGLENAKLYIVGPYKNIDNISDFDPKYVEKCLSYVAENNLQKKVIFTDILSAKQTYEIYQKSKALLFFSKKEGMPNVVIEAMAHNCVPILSPMDGVANEIVEDKYGFVLDNKFETIAIDKIESLIRSGSLLDRIKEKYLLQNIAKKYMRIYIA